MTSSEIVRAVRNVVTGVIRCALWGLYWLSHLSIRDDRVCVFGGGFDAFSNGKHLALHMVRTHPSLRVSWISHDRASVHRIRQAGLTAHYKWSLRGIAWTARARWVFVNSYSFDVNFWLTGGACRINLWHGIPLKKLGFDITTGPLARIFQAQGVRRLFYRFLSSAYQRPDFMVSTSEETRTLFAKAFRLPAARCPPLGYARTDLFFWESARLRAFIERHEPLESRFLAARASGASRVWAYVPTWRDSQRDFISESGIDWEVADQACQESGSLLILKLHPLTNIDGGQLSGLRNIRLLPRMLDLYPLLPFVDALITDYSSIYFDFLLLDRPIVFFPFDLDEYLVDSRAMYFDYDEITPGVTARSATQLYEYLRNGPPDGWEVERAAVRTRIWQEVDGHSADRVIDFLARNRPSLREFLA